jgi:hypothetical protein
MNAIAPFPTAEPIARSVKVTGLLRIDGKLRTDGNKIIAFFDAEIADAIVLRGCSLVRTRNNGMTVWVARGVTDNQNRVRHSVSIIDSSLLHQIMEAARETYRAMGGTEAEWTPR